MNPETTVTWTPDSWRHRPAAQQPVYKDPQALQTVLAELSDLPPPGGG